MTVYIKVPEITFHAGSDPCMGCIADAQEDSEHFVEGLCVKLREANKGCVVGFDQPGYIFIEDTEAARLAYITLKLEN